ncbi:MAG: 4a-hydroxytetrahydrobiopterin dehydratase [Gammaproteobacteria bacterium]|nr:4a-hydroxytetrahydrobiopterin dehydratase [Gammaproteobacteria bacterium]
MTDLAERRCKPCEGGVQPLGKAQALELGAQVASWSLDDAGTRISKTYQFKNYYQTMAFVNAVAWVAHHEDHHPDMEVSWNRCVVHYTTHAINGLSENDFICAAKVDHLFMGEQGQSGTITAQGT